MAMNSSFGEYITKEYGLLKQILSYLKPCDLGIAKLVCRDWYCAVNSLIDKNPIMVIRETDKNTVPFFANRKPILPAFVLHQTPYCILEDAPLVQCSKCTLPFILGLCPCSIVGPDTVYISLSTNTLDFHQHCDPDTSSSFYGFCQMFMGLLVPTSDHIKVSVFRALPRDPVLKKPITEEFVDQCFGGREPIKCLLVLSEKTSVSTKWLNNLLSEVVRRQGMTFAIGGGEVSVIDCKMKSNVLTPFWTRCDLLLISLRGDNVIAHSDILDAWTEPEVKKFMTKFAKTVGPLPEGATRMAFLAQCVDRVGEEVESMEWKAFQKAFPSVPLFGVRALGEFGVRSTTNGMTSAEKSTKRRRMNVSFVEYRTSSFVVLTFKKV